MYVWLKSIHFFKRYGADKPFTNILKPPVALKIGSRSPKSNQFVYYAHIPSGDMVKTSLFQLSKTSCDLANRVKVTKILSVFFLNPIMYICKFGENPSISSRDMVQTRSCAAVDADADRIRTKSNMSPPMVEGGGGQGLKSIISCMLLSIPGLMNVQVMKAKLLYSTTCVGRSEGVEDSTTLCLEWDVLLGRNQEKFWDSTFCPKPTVSVHTGKQKENLRQLMFVQEIGLVRLKPWNRK